MDKNTITGLVLMALVLIGFSWYSQPSEAELQEMARQDSIARVEQERLAIEAKAKQKEIETKQTELATDSNALFFSQRGGNGETIILDNNLLKVALNTKGGSIESASLTEFKNQKGENVTVLPNGSSKLSYAIAGKEENLNTEDFTFDIVNRNNNSLTMRLGDESRHLDITYTLPENSYHMDIAISGKGLKNILLPTANSIYIKWNDLCAQQEKGFDFEQRYSKLTYRDVSGDTDYLSDSKDATENIENDLQWVAFKNQFFSAVLIAENKFQEVSLHSSPQEKGSGNLKLYEANMSMPFDVTEESVSKMTIYIGPNKFGTLQTEGEVIGNGRDLELEELVDLGWPLFRIVNRWFIMPLFDMLTNFGISMGWVLLLLTLIVKALVYPATKKSFMSSAKMRVLKPEIDALSQKYPKQEDAMKKQQEMMQLYSQYGVSPMGGCLPMLIQMPIWIALFNFVPNAIELRGESFLWADDLSSYDELIHWGTDLWLIGDHLSIFCLLFCATNIINTWISMRQQQNQMSSEQAQQMKMMQYMMYGMPIVFFFIFNNYSSGLCYYYFLSGLISILMMWYMRKTTDDVKLKAKLDAYREQHKNDAKKPGSLAARLEALQKMQEAQQKK